MKPAAGYRAAIRQFSTRSLRRLVFLFQAATPWPFIAAYARTILFVKPRLWKRYGQDVARFKEQTRPLSFSQGWFCHHIPAWLSVLDREKFGEKKEIAALEIGCWEGMSGLFLLQHYPRLKLVCVDTWAGGDEHAGFGGACDAERRFDQNLAPYADRIEKFKGTSFSFFSGCAGRERFDLIYVDGSHYADDVLIDAVKGFEMMAVGGIMIFDDVMWQYYRRARDNPIGAVNAFMDLKKGCYQTLQVGSQLIIKKTRDSERQLCAA